MHQGCASDAGDFKRDVSCLVPTRQRLEHVERTFAPVEAPSHARRGAPVVSALPSWTVNKGAWLLVRGGGRTCSPG